MSKRLVLAGKITNDDDLRSRRLQVEYAVGKEILRIVRYWPVSSAIAFPRFFANLETDLAFNLLAHAEEDALARAGLVDDRHTDLGT